MGDPRPPKALRWFLIVLSVVSGRPLIDVPSAFLEELTAGLYCLASAFFGLPLFFFTGTSTGLFIRISRVGSDFRPEEVCSGKPSESARLVRAIAEYGSWHT